MLRVGFKPVYVAKQAWLPKSRSTHTHNTRAPAYPTKPHSHSGAPARPLPSAGLPGLERSPLPTASPTARRLGPATPRVASAPAMSQVEGEDEIPPEEIDEATLKEVVVLFRNPETEGLGKTCQDIASSTALEVLIICAIVINTLILCVQNPANQFSEGTTLLLTVADLILSGLFTVEMCIRIRAMGFIGHRGYLDVRQPSKH